MDVGPPRVTLTERAQEVERITKVPVETINGIIERERNAFPPPWFWWGYEQNRDLMLMSAQKSNVVMNFERWGEGDDPYGRVRFHDHESGLLVPINELATFDHNGLITGVNHPDALFIQHARQDVRTLLEMVRTLAHIQDMNYEVSNDVMRRALTDMLDYAKSHLPASLGVAVFCFDYGDGPGRSMFYGSTAGRSSMVPALREWLARQA